jgi:hypothetical protein
MSVGSGGSVNSSVLASRLAHLTAVQSSLSLSQSTLVLSSILHSVLLTDPRQSIGRRLHANALLDGGQPSSALHLVKATALAHGDVELAQVGARACHKLGRNREGLDLMDKARLRREEKRRQRPYIEPGQSPSARNHLWTRARKALSARPSEFRPSRGTRSGRT